MTSTRADRKTTAARHARAQHRHGRRDARLRDSRLLPGGAQIERADANAIADCGWGRLIFAQTFDDGRDVVAVLRHEAEGQRDVAMYVSEPHVALAQAPQEVFLDPSHTYRLWLAHYRFGGERPRGFLIRRLRDRGDAVAVNRIYARQVMVPVAVDFLLAHRGSATLAHLVAEDEHTGDVVGTATGVDHRRAFNDPEQGASLWCLAVDPQAALPGIGEALVRHLADHFLARGRSYLDLSVMHDNAQAIALYEKLGFQRQPLFCLKHKSAFNERLFIAPEPDAGLNPYARIIVHEARRRGIAVAVEDETADLFRLSFGGRTVACRESLSELTSAVALARCDDKALTRRVLARAGLAVPAQTEAGNDDENLGFLARHRSVVVKPARGEQGAGISVGITDAVALGPAIERARRVCDRVLLEEFRAGQDLRIVVIDHKLVAAALRKPAAVAGNGRDTIASLIRAQSRRRAAATGGESRIPIDAETERCLTEAGVGLDTVLESGRQLAVRRTANLHTGGTIHDVTEQVHPALADAATRASRALDIPVVGLDLIVEAPDRPGHVIIEANERPGLANHEPQPTARRFIDLLFPQTAVEGP